MSTENTKTPSLIAYQIETGKDKNYWHRIGAAWKNSKGGYQIKLNSLPLNGELVLMPPKEES